jgi:hypothetical protein
VVFVPSGEAPNDDDRATLVDINARITALGGDPMVADDEPTGGEQ